MLAEIGDRRIADGGPAERDRAGRRCVVALVISLPSLMRRDTGHGTPPDSTATGTIAPPDGGDVPTPHRGRLAWWRLRSWRKDVDVLARVRDGLQNLPDSADEDDAPASESELARPSESMPQGASAEAPSPSADPAAPDEPLRYEPGQHLTVQTPRWPHVWRAGRASQARPAQLA